MLEGRIRTFNDSDFLKQMELAIQYGFPFMFENVDEYIDPVIDPILEKVTVSGPGGRKTVKLGDKDIEWVSSNILSLLSFPSLSRLYVAKNMQLLLKFPPDVKQFIHLYQTQFVDTWDKPRSISKFTLEPTRT